MGFLNFLRKFVTGETEKKEEREREIPPTVEVKLIEIDKFILPFDKETEKELKDKESYFYSKINDKKEELKRLSEELKRFDINKRKDPEKVKFVVNQNRESYLAFIAIFLLDVDKLNKEDGIEKNTEKIRKNLDNFTRQSARNYYIMNELIGKELINITSKLKEIDYLLREFVSSNKELLEKIKGISELNKKISEIKEKSVFLKEIERNKAILEQKKNEHSKRKANMEGGIEKIKMSDEFKKNSEIHEKIKNKEREIFDLGCFISREANFKVLEKYSHYSPENKKIIDRFEEDCFVILQEKNGEQFLRIIKECIDLIKQGKIQVKALQKEKVIKSFSDFSKEKIEKLKENYEKLKKGLEELKNQAKPIDIEEKQRELERINSESKLLEREAVLEDEKREKLLNKLKEDVNEIESTVSKIFNKNIKVIDIG